MRKVINLNYDWYFKNEFFDEYIKDYNNVVNFISVDLPHNAVDIDYNYFNEQSIHLDCTYKKEIFIEKDWKNKIIVLEFDGISNVSHIFINDEFVMTHKGAYTSFKCNITEYVNFGENNMVTIYVNSHQNNNVPPFGGPLDFLTYAGMYREARLIVLDVNHISSVFVKTYDPVNSSMVNLEIETAKIAGTLEIILMDKEEELINTKVLVNRKTMKVNIDLPSKKLWTLDEPYLYYAKVRYYKDDDCIDEVKVRFGFREVCFKRNAFYLNGEPLELIGLNRNQAYPYVGYAMPKRIQEEDANILKYQLGCNIVRCSNCPPSEHFLNRCDEIGLLVFEEIPGSNYIGNDEWKELTYTFVEDMIISHRNHPSICLWGVRISNSIDSKEFYTKTNEMAHKLDDTRQTSGVRNIKNSEVLEDVFAFSDYTYNESNALATNNKKMAYIVAEHTGYTFPVKNSDCEKNHFEHSLRHLKVINEFRKRKDIQALIGWTMTDYNSYNGYTSRDGICYHGVLDMFRNPKLAAYAYQAELSQEITLELVYQLNNRNLNYCDLKVFAFTNCDYIKVYRNDQFVGSFSPHKESFTHLKHPPIIIDDFIGQLIEINEGMTQKDSLYLKKLIVKSLDENYNLFIKNRYRLTKLLRRYALTKKELEAIIFKYVRDYKSNVFRFEGYIGEELKKVVYKEHNYEFKYLLETTTDELTLGTTYDALRVVVKRVNQNNELLKYASDSLKINVSGAIRLIGPNRLSLNGGQIAFWVRTIGEVGKGIIEIEADKKIVKEIIVKDS